MLDCCYAGLATITNDAGKLDYAKELIAATSWDTDTSDRLAPALCQALAIWNSDSNTRTAASLFERLTMELRQMRIKADEGELEGIEILERMKRVADRNLKKSRKEHHKLQVQVLDIKIAQAFVEREVEDYEHESDMLQDKLDSAKRHRAATKGQFRQPHYSTAMSPTVTWNLRPRKGRA